MIKINEYINEYNLINIFNKKIYEEVKLIEKLNLIQLFRQINESIDEDLLLEGDGTFKGQRILADYINSILKNVNKDKTIIIDNFSDFKTIVFFKNIIINFIEDDNIEGGYVSSLLNKDTINVIWDFTKNEFNYLVINLNKNIDDYFNKLIHELKHAHDDYEELKNNRNNLIYKKIIKTKYELIKFNKNDDDYVKEIKFINYLMTKFEMSAITSEISSYIKNDHYQISDALDEIKKSQLYKDIINSYNNVNFILSNDKEKDKYCIMYNKIYKTNYSNDHIINNLKKNFNDFYNKFINHLSNGIEKHILHSTF